MKHVRIYRVSQEEKSIFWEVILSIILSKKLYMNICPIANDFRDRAILVVWLGRPVLSLPPALLRHCLKSNGSISETVRNRTHVHIKFFCLEWPILWPPRILSFPPGTPCIQLLLRWAKHVTRMGDRKCAYRVGGGRPERKETKAQMGGSY
jgi:hypothetical protein